MKEYVFTITVAGTDEPPLVEASFTDVREALRRLGECMVTHPADLWAMPGYMPHVQPVKIEMHQEPGFPQLIFGAFVTWPNGDVHYFELAEAGCDE